MKNFKRIKKEFPNNKVKFIKKYNSKYITEWDIKVDGKKLKTTFKDISGLFKLENFNFYQMQEDHLKKTIEKIKKELLQRKVLKD